MRRGSRCQAAGVSANGVWDFADGSERDDVGLGSGGVGKRRGERQSQSDGHCRPDHIEIQHRI
jgi:hypothetical protein